MLFLVRHGATPPELERRWWGRAEVPLADTAPWALREAAEQLHRFRPTRLVASPLGRALASARLMAPVLGLPVEVVPALTEVDLGDFSALTARECQALFPSQWQAYLADTVDTAPPGGEPYRRMAGRVRQWALAQSPEAQIVAVTHTGVILALACLAMGLPLRERVRIGQVPPASWSLLTLTPPVLHRLAQPASPLGGSPPADRL